MTGIEINDTAMTYDADNYARRDARGWTVTLADQGRMDGLTRDQAITALTIAECTAAGFGADHPLIVSLRAEL
jgi:hypothetical protein